MDQEILSQDEIDALLKGVNAGEVETEAPPPAPGEIRPHDLATQQRIVRGRMPTLEMINGRFARLLRLGLFNTIRRSPEISVKPIQVIKFSEYTQTLPMPASLNMVKINPLRGTALFVLDPKLVFSVVDNFFGGQGRHAKIEGREFTLTENRIIQMLLRQAFADMQEAWSPIARLEVEYVNSEINPQFAHIVSPSEIVVVSSFKINLEGSGGQLDITMPYSMIEPLRDSLDSGVQSDRADRDENWLRQLRQEIEDADLQLLPIVGNSTLTVRQLLNLKAGDIIPCDFDGQVTLVAEGVPVLRGNLGSSRGQQAVKITERMTRRKAPLLANTMPDR
jgi:flagellar motor switch protein FliM